jgi:WD40 repeat protein
VPNYEKPEIVKMKIRNVFYLLVVMGFFFIGCTPGQTDERSALPSGTEMPTDEGLETWSPLLPPYVMPYPRMAIGPENASRVVELARLGKGEITDFAWSPDGMELAVASPMGIFLYSSSSLEEIGNINGGNHVSSIAFSPDGRTLASMSDREGNVIRLWNVGDGSPMHILDLGDHSVISMAFSPDGESLALGFVDGTIQIWRVSDSNLIGTWAGHSDKVSMLAFSPDEQRLVSSSSDETIRLWRTSDGNLIRTFKDPTGLIRSNVAFSPDGQMLASISEWDDYAIRLWSVADGSLVHTLEGHSYFVESISFSPDGQTLASSSADHTINFWRVTDGDLIRTLQGHPHDVENVAFSPDGQTLASISSIYGIRFWRVSDGGLIGALGWEGEISWTHSFAFSPDGRMLASISNSEISIWNIADGSLVRTLEYPNAGESGAIFSLDGQTLLWFTGSPMWGFNLTHWKVSDGSLIRNLELEEVPSLSTFSSSVQVSSPNHTVNLKSAPSWVSYYTFSLDRQTLALGSQDEITLWNTSDGSLIRTIVLKRGVTSVVGLTFSPDGQTLASGFGDYTVKLWRVSDGSLIRTLRKHAYYATTLAFSPDGQTLASESYFDRVRFWRVSDGKLIHELNICGDYISSMAFSPDWQLLAAASEGGIKLWRVSDGSLIYTLGGPSSEVSNVIRFSPDGKLLASGLHDGTVQLWGVMP